MSELEKIKNGKSFNNAQNTKTVLLLDSGIGGLHILKECIKLMPDLNYIYVADTVNAPYGNKSKKELIKIADKLVFELNAEFNPDFFVLACNSLTVNCIEFLRNKYNKTFIGIEPALKQARLNSGDTIIFATQTTLKSYHKLNKKCTKQLKKEYKKQNLRYSIKDKVYKVFIPDLPSKIDENCNDLNVLNPILINKFDNSQYKKASNLVLGCTHFIAIEPQLKQILNDVQIFDGAIPVAKRLQSLVQANMNDQKEIVSDLKIDKVLKDENKTFSKDAKEDLNSEVGAESNKIESNSAENEIKSDETETNSLSKDETGTNSLGKDETETAILNKKDVKEIKINKKASKKTKLSKIKILSLDGNPNKKALLKQYFSKIM